MSSCAQEQRHCRPIFDITGLPGDVGCLHWLIAADSRVCLPNGPSGCRFGVPEQIETALSGPDVWRVRGSLG